MRALAAASTPQLPSCSGSACFGIRFFIGCALIILMIIHTILLDPSGAVDRRDIQPEQARCFWSRSGRGGAFASSPTTARPARPTAPSRWPGAARGGRRTGRRYRVEACEGHRPAPDEGGRPPPSPAAGRPGGRLAAAASSGRGRRGRGERERRGWLDLLHGTPAPSQPTTQKRPSGAAGASREGYETGSPHNHCGRAFRGTGRSSVLCKAKVHALCHVRR
jgi:hypothetical protein